VLSESQFRCNRLPIPRSIAQGSPYDETPPRRQVNFLVLNLFLFVIGIALLYQGAQWLVDGSSRLAKALGLSPLVIGLTVVAFGTSSPELVVSVVSSVQQKSMIATGNVVGSNICNIALVLGLSAALTPIRGSASVIRRDIPIMLGVSLYLLLISIDSSISRFEGFTLFIGIILYTILNYRWDAKAVSDPLTQAISAEPFWMPGRLGQLLLIAGGIGGVVWGADLMINSAVIIMKRFGFSEKFIGLTVVAFGTSLPELATSAMAIAKKEMDISIGNLVGSNVFNILCVLGAAAMVRPIPIPEGLVKSGLLVDYLVMMATSALPMLLMRRSLIMDRKGGIILLTCYAGYLTYLVGKS